MKRQEKPMGMVVGRMMKEFFRVMKKRSMELTEEKLTIEQFRFLKVISLEHDEMIQKDIAEIMGKDKSSVLRMVDTLEERGLLRRVVDANDRRKNLIMVSKKGERAIEKFMIVELELTNEVVEGLSDADLEAFQRVINHVQMKAQKL
jgi:MarR family transcriptional regulator, transcriptional regulator for hemolysin